MKINLFQRIVTLSFISSTVLLVPITTQALTVEEVINPRINNGGWVVDMADVLSSKTEAELNSLIDSLEQKNSAEIAVVTVPDTSSDSPKAFATQLFNYWGIGKAELDNGILFLISIEDRRVEIETGLGMENILPNSQLSSIIDHKITPQYKRGNFDRGTLDGTKALVAAVDSDVIKNNNINWNLSYILSLVSLTSIGGFVIWRRNKQNKVFIDPHKASVTFTRNGERNIYCAECQQAMKRVENIELTKAQKVAEKIGAVSYKGYKCANCSSQTQAYTTVIYPSFLFRYQNCPNCEEFTVIRTEETLEPATYKNKGKLLIVDKCHCCDYLQETTKDIPCLHNYPNKKRDQNRSNNSITYYEGSCGGSSSSSGGSSSGCFGGGSSDGGGAGDSW